MKTKLYGLLHLLYGLLTSLYLLIINGTIRISRANASTELVNLFSVVTYICLLLESLLLY